MASNSKSFTIRLPDYLYKRIEKECQLCHGVSKSKVIVRWLDEYIKKNK